MRTILKDEILFLEAYQFTSDELSKSQKNRKENEYLLCVKKTKYSSQIAGVRRVDVTVREIVKRFFCFGKLAGCDLRLSSIAAHLEQLDLSPVVHGSRAYNTVHNIAARMLRYKKSGKNIPALWKKLATSSHYLTVDRCTEHRRDLHSPTYQVNSSKNHLLYLTPLTKYGHLRAEISILENNYATSAVTIGGWGQNYQPWYTEISDSKTVDTSSLNRIFFRIIERISCSYTIPNHIYYSYPPSRNYD